MFSQFIIHKKPYVCISEIFVVFFHGLLFTINSNGFLYAPSHRQDYTYSDFCYTRRGALTGTRSSIMGHHGPRIDQTLYHGVTFAHLTDRRGFTAGFWYYFCICIETTDGARFGVPYNSSHDNNFAR